ncbi:MAG: CocE/NonD family hydrolase [Chloroflexota bacterium]
MFWLGFITTFFLTISLIVLFFRKRWYARRFGLPPAQYQVGVRRKIPVPMADGVLLYGDHYAPRGPGTFPTVLIRSPYGRGWESFPLSLLLIFIGQRFAERGYHVFVQVVRGQYDSGGDFLPFAHEKEDGLATIKWLRTQSWFNGKIGMLGASYMGLVQWAVASDPAIKALVPIKTGSDVYTHFFADKVVALEFAARWMLIVVGSGRGMLKRRMSYLQHLRNLFQSERLVPAAFQSPSLRDADRAMLGEPVSFYQLWLEASGEAEHPYWQAATYREQIRATGAAVHLIGGWHDFFIRGQLEDYHTLKAAGQNPYLTIGPWTHLENGSTGAQIRDAVDWFDVHLKGAANRLRKLTVRLFVIGANEWREMESYPPPGQPIRFYLAADGVLASSPSTDETAATSFVYDPADPTPSIGGNLMNVAAGPVDNGPLESRSDVICFTSEPLTADLEIIGTPNVTIYMQASTSHTDLFVRLNDVDAAVISLNVTDYLYRIEPEQRVEGENGMLQLTFDLLPTAYRFKRGHRLRLLLAGGAHPRWARNLGTGIDGEFVVQAHTICHDISHPSVIRLPQIPCE